MRCGALWSTRIGGSAARWYVIAAKKNGPCYVDLVEVSRSSSLLMERSEMTSPGSTALAVTVTIPERRAWLNAAALLVASLRRNGGEVRMAPVTLSIIGKAENFQRRVHPGLTLCGLERSRVSPYLNKINGLARLDVVQTTHVLLLDHDTIILHCDGLEDYICDGVAARRNHKAHLARILGQTYVSAISGDDLPPWDDIAYYNSGVVLCSRTCVAPLSNRWHYWGERLTTAWGNNPLGEQVGFAVAAAEGRLPCADLPGMFNTTSYGPLLPNARIIHYTSATTTNRRVKERWLNDFQSFREFLTGTNDAFWRQYATNILDCLPLAVEVASALEASLADEG